MMTQLLMVDTDHALLEVDHLQIYTGGGLPDIFALSELGLNNASAIVRRETQGTASALFFFENAYLEVIAIEDEDVFRQYSARARMNLPVRSQWQRTGASPFGVGLRPKAYHQSHSDLMGDSALWTQWGYRETTINFSSRNLEAVQEPICFTIPHQIALTNWLDHSNADHQQLLTHPLGIRRLTGIKIEVNTLHRLSDAVSLLQDNGIITIERGPSPLLELTFDGNARDRVVDARPFLPIQLKY